MIKLSIAIAGANALPSAFVVYRGFEESIKKAAALGFDGVELALKTGKEVDPGELSFWLKKYNMEVSCISTGQVYADTGLMFTEESPERRSEVKKVFCGIIDLAADFGQLVNIGRVRGQIGEKTKERAEELFLDMARFLCRYAEKKGVTIILEPVNRYEIDFINSLQEGVDLVHKAQIPNFKLMPDIFHMNIEDQSIGGELKKHIDHVAYIHFADSNRLAPGMGHTDIKKILDDLSSVAYEGWVSLEILPKPNPDSAAKQGISYLKPLIDQYNINKGL